MGFLDKKERVFDVTLTAKGRELLSQNLLDFSYYAFSDEGVDYAGALTASLDTSGSIDDYIRKTLTFEGNQVFSSREYKDLQSFLYTVPERRKTLPEFITNFDDRLDISANRRFFIDSLSLTARVKNVIEKPVAVIARTVKSSQTLKKKLKDYVQAQNIKQTKQRLNQRKNVIGMAIGPNHVMKSNNFVLDIKKQKVQPLDTFVQKTFEEKIDVVSVSQDVEIVTGLDRVKIDFTLKSSEGLVDDSSGYLIEVFESGSDGVLTKLFEEDVVDVLDEDKILQKGFSNDLFLDIDSDNAELISDVQRLRRQQLRRRESEQRRLERQLAEKIKKTKLDAGNA